MRAKRLTTTVCTVASVTLMGSVLALGTSASAMLRTAPITSDVAPPGGINLCPCDLDRDRQVGVTDMLELLRQWGMDPGGPPDFNRDGVVDTTDFLVLLNEWGPC